MEQRVDEETIPDHDDRAVTVLAAHIVRVANERGNPELAHDVESSLRSRGKVATGAELAAIDEATDALMHACEYLIAPPRRRRDS